MKRAVITGIGIVSPLGCTVDSFWERLVSGTSGIGPITLFDTSEYTTRIAGEVIEYDVDSLLTPKDRRRMDEFTQYGMSAAKLAIAHSGLDLDAESPERMGAIVSSGIGGLHTLQRNHSLLLEKGPSRCSPFMIPQMITNMASGMIAIEFNLQGPNCSMVSACATASHSIGYAQRHIQWGEADIMLAGGAEAAVIELGVSGFANMKALSRRNDDPQGASRPFDRDRDGFVMADGAAVLVIEELAHAKARDATIFCEVAGFGQTCDAHHMTALMESGDGGARAMSIAVKDAGLNPDEIDYVNAHGTSTPLNDKIETRAIKSSLGEENAGNVMISSSKSMTGHMLGAAGGIETAVCALAIKHGVIPPTINQETSDPDCDLDYVPNTARETPVKTCLNNSFGFGGHNVCLVIKALE